MRYRLCLLPLKNRSHYEGALALIDALHRSLIVINQATAYILTQGADSITALKP